MLSELQRKKMERGEAPVGIRSSAAASSPITGFWADMPPHTAAVAEGVPSLIAPHHSILSSASGYALIRELKKYMPQRKNVKQDKLSNYSPPPQPCAGLSAPIPCALDARSLAS